MAESCPVPRWQLLKQQLHNVNAAEFEQLRTKEDYVTLDVRTPEEFQQFHLEGAQNMDYLGPDFLQQLDDLTSDKTYLVYCRSGRRSVRACIMMKNAGIPNIIHLDGGLNAWPEKNN